VRRGTRFAFYLLGGMLLGGGIGATGPMTAWAADPFAAKPQVTFSPQQRADITRIEGYLNGVPTLAARFLQMADNGGQTTGTLLISRPGKMRVDYDPPMKDFIVADGWFVFHWDGELEQQSSTPLGSTLADVILREKIKLSGDITVKSVGRQAGVVEVTLFESGDATKGEITLVFEDRPLILRSWRVLDAQGLTTKVMLSDVRTGVKLDEDRFVFRVPAGAKQ